MRWGEPCTVAAAQRQAGRGRRTHTPPPPGPPRSALLLHPPPPASLPRRPRPAARAPPPHPPSTKPAVRLPRASLPRSGPRTWVGTRSGGPHHPSCRHGLFRTPLPAIPLRTQTPPAPGSRTQSPGPLAPPLTRRSGPEGRLHQWPQAAAAAPAVGPL